MNQEQKDMNQAQKDMTKNQKDMTQEQNDGTQELRNLIFISAVPLHVRNFYKCVRFRFRKTF